MNWHAMARGAGAALALLAAQACAATEPERQTAPADTPAQAGGACDDIDSCMDAGSAHEAAGRTADAQQAWRRGCALEGTGGVNCTFLGLSLSDARPVPPEALSLLAAGCDGHQGSRPMACERLADLRLSGAGGVAIDRREALAALDMACATLSETGGQTDSNANIPLRDRLCARHARLARELAAPQE